MKMPKSKKKQQPLPQRPAPPTFEKITEDIEAAKNGDIIFNLMKTSPSSESVGDSDENGMMYESYDSMDMDVSTEQVSAIESMYQKAEQFLSNYNELKSAPEKLSEQYEHLEAISDNLAQTVKSLRAKAKTTLKQS